MLGRTFVADDDKGRTPTVAIISSGLWKRRFGSDPRIIGKEVPISGRLITIIGVMPPGFEYPEQTQIWMPAGFDSSDEKRDNRSVFAFARLKSGVTLRQAQSQINAINTRLARQFPETNAGWETNLFVLHERMVREVKPALIALLGAVGFVLLIACANIANLLLARSAARQKEVAIRSALGASRARIVRQLLTESLLLSIIGGLGGILLSFWLTDLLLSMVPAEAPRLDQVRLDYHVLMFATGLSALTAFFFGLVPALHGSRLEVTTALKEGGRSGDGYRRTGARNLLLIGEVALSLVLLVGAGLLVKSFMRLQEVQPGFNPHHLLVASVSLPGAKYKAEDRPEFFRRLQERIGTLPGVVAGGGSINLPLNASGYAIGRAFIPEGRPMSLEAETDASFYTITGDYFRALQTPLLAGRFFDVRDTNNAPKVLIVNEWTAKHFYGSAVAALGKRMTIWRDEKFPREIVGVVGDTKAAALDRETEAQIYVPHAQDPEWPFMALVIRTAGDPAAFASTLRREVQSLDKDQPIYSVRTMDDVLLNSLGTRRISVQLFTVFACIALLLAAVGIYGVVAYSVTQRTREIGIRMALGAQAGDVLRMVVRQGMSLALIGVVAGWAGAFALTRLLAKLLFGIGATDPTIFMALSALLMLVAFLACYVPARRAAAVNPLEALAYE